MSDLTCMIYESNTTSKFIYLKENLSRMLYSIELNTLEKIKD